MNLSERIRDTRKGKGLSQIEVARKAGISVNSLRYYEANKRTPRIDHLHFVANALDVSVPFLLYGTAENEGIDDVQSRLTSLEMENEHLRGMVAAYERILGKVMPNAHP